MAPVHVVVALGDRARGQQWRDALRAEAPDFVVSLADEVRDRASARFAVIWRPPPGALAGFTNLEALLSLGAGVDTILRSPEFPAGLPIIRMVDEALTQGMREYVLLHVLRYHRGEPARVFAQAAERWEPGSAPLARDRRVGIMGLGVLGRDAALHLAHVGFDVKGWSRTAKSIPDIETFHGADTLYRFAAAVEILVCLLPFTPATENVLNARLFAAMPRQSCLVNAARGELLIEQDLLEALASGQIAAATLDAFREEPLPPGHPFWRHSAITVTPHDASLTRLDSGARHMVSEIQRILAGKPPRHGIDQAVGY